MMRTLWAVLAVACRLISRCKLRGSVRWSRRASKLEARAR